MPSMRTDTPQPIRLADYTPPAFLIDEVHLDFALAANTTQVKAKLTIRRNGDHADPLVLNGERLKPISVAIDGRVLNAGEHTIDAEFLTIPGVPDTFVLETHVEIDPEANKALDGLYMSGGRFCTQCEAEGFRKITWYPDRPDVLSRFTVRIEADKKFRHLLSNGNLMSSGDLPGGRHFAVWNDPFPKPAYLFALVGGELDVLEDKLVTMSGRTVDLRIFIDTGMADRAAYAMDALKRSMIWDEQAFGREYDLDLFMIVAVRDFNFGAMENKGLNIFNSSLLLADPATATDLDYERIESVVQRVLIVEIPVVPVKRKARTGDRHDPRIRSALNYFVPVGRGQNDNLMTELRPQPQLLLDVGFHPAAVRGVKSADVHDPHGPRPTLLGLQRPNTQTRLVVHDDRDL